MNKKLGFTAAILAGILVYPTAVFAKEAKSTPVPEKRKPIVSKWKTMGGMRDYYGGIQLKRLEDYQAVMSPLHDAECDRLLNLSGSSETTGVIFVTGGAAVVATGLVIALSDRTPGEFTSGETTGLIVALGGMVIDYFGAFHLIQSRTSRFNAVERYNAIVHGDDLQPYSLQKRGIQADLLAFRF